MEQNNKEEDLTTASIWMLLVSLSGGKGVIRAGKGTVKAVKKRLIPSHNLLNF